MSSLDTILETVIFRQLEDGIGPRINRLDFPKRVQGSAGEAAQLPKNPPREFQRVQLSRVNPIGGYTAGRFLEETARMTTTS